MQLITFITAFIIILLCYFKLLRPWQIRWGTTDNNYIFYNFGDIIRHDE